MDFPTLSDGTRNWCATCCSRGEDAFDESSVCSDCQYKQDTNGKYDRSKEPTEYIEKRESNFEMLRRMDMEQMATWIETIANCDVCPMIHDCRAYDGASHASCRLKWLKWLRSDGMGWQSGGSDT